MYIQNRRESSIFKGCNPLHILCSLIANCPLIAFFAYTNRYATVKKRFLRKSIYIFLILILSCNGSKKATETTQSNYVLTESEYVIFTFQEKSHRIFKDAKPTELTQTELTEIEEILKIAVDNINQTQEQHFIKDSKEYRKYKRTNSDLELRNYYRQYVPVINKMNEKEVWINFFCNNFGTEILTVHDGGNCFWNIKVNLTKKEYSKLRINGHG